MVELCSSQHDRRRTWPFLNRVSIPGSSCNACIPSRECKRFCRASLSFSRHPLLFLLPQEVGESDPQCLSGEGGAIHASGSGLTLRNVKLARNRCETGAIDAGCSGGAISITGSGPSSAPAEAARSLARELLKRPCPVFHLCAGLRRQHWRPP